MFLHQFSALVSQIIFLSYIYQFLDNILYDIQYFIASQIPSPKSRNCKQQSSSQQPQPSPTQHHKYQQYQGVNQSTLVRKCAFHQ